MIATAIALWAALALAVACIYYVRYVEPTRIAVTRVEVPIEGLPEALEDLTIAHMSDFHCRPTRASEHICREAVRLAGAARPDLVALSGDLADGYDLYDECAGQLEGLSAPLGVWAVLGNHDHYRYEGHPFRRVKRPTDEQRTEALAAAGVDLLLNQAVRLEIRGADVALVGVGDKSCGRDALPEALVGTEDADLVIVLSHSPDVLDDPAIEAAHLVLCGHTHGGQITLPGIGSPWAPVWRDRRRSSGLMRGGGQLCHVTRGVASATQARFRCPPEVALLVLRRGTSDGVRPVRVHRDLAGERRRRPAAEEVAS